MRQTNVLQYRLQFVFGGMLALFAASLSADVAKAQDSALLVRRDRIREAIINDPHVPLVGKYQNATNTQFFARLQWTNHNDWLVTDDQRFDTDGTFGPIASIIPADELNTFTHAQFDAAGSRGLLVGAIVVDAPWGTSLPDSYDRLNLVAGRNCIRLRKTGDTTFVAYVFPSNDLAPDPCRPPTPLPQALQVVRVSAKPNAGGANIPPVARWHEGKRGHRDRMNFGLKCVDAWCIALGLQADTLKLPHKGRKPTQRAWETHGWHDVQRLAVMHNGQVVPGRHQASIIPHPDLGQYTIRQNFDTGWVHSATVVIDFEPVGRYAKYGRPPSPDEKKYWGFLKGDNEIYLRTTTDSVTYPSGWRAQVRHKNAEPYELLVIERHEHKPKRIPGTARFRWIEDDDGDWIRCEDGCCKIGVF